MHSRRNPTNDPNLNAPARVQAVMEAVHRDKWWTRKELIAALPADIHPDDGYLTGALRILIKRGTVSRTNDPGNASRSYYRLHPPAKDGE